MSNTLVIKKMNPEQYQDLINTIEQMGYDNPIEVKFDLIYDALQQIAEALNKFSTLP